MLEADKWTLVPIRGKGRKRKPLVHNSISPTTSSSVEVESAVIPDQPRYIETPYMSPARRKRQKAKISRKRTTQCQDDPSLSPLECLPTELLDTIFFLCLNFSLPQASLCLGRRLGSDHVKIKLYSMTFHHSLSPSREYWLELLRHRTNRTIEASEVLPLAASWQRSLLSLKWMTLDYLRQLVSRCMLDEARTFLSQHRISSTNPQSLGNASILSQIPGDDLSDFFCAAQSCSDKRWAVVDSYFWTWPLSGDHMLKVTLRFHQDFPHSMSIDIGKATNVIREKFINYTDLLYCMRGCRLPPESLSGPWTSSKCTLLAQLVRAGCVLDRTGSTTDEEDAKQALHDAIAQSSIRAIVTLVGSMRNFKAGCVLPGCVLCEDGGSHRGDKCVGVIYLSQLGVTVTTEHLKHALYLDRSLPLLECLLDAMNIDINWRDPEILAWAVDRRTRDDKRGEFLFDRQADDEKIKITYWSQSRLSKIEERRRMMLREWINSQPSWLYEEDDLDAQLEGTRKN